MIAQSGPGHPADARMVGSGLGTEWTMTSPGPHGAAENKPVCTGTRKGRYSLVGGDPEAVGETAQVIYPLNVLCLPPSSLTSRLHLTLRFLKSSQETRSPNLCGPGGPQHSHPEDLSLSPKQRGPWQGWMARSGALQETADGSPGAWSHCHEHAWQLCQPQSKQPPF